MNVVDIIFYMKNPLKINQFEGGNILNTLCKKSTEKSYQFFFLNNNFYFRV